MQKLLRDELVYNQNSKPSYKEHWWWININNSIIHRIKFKKSEKSAIMIVIEMEKAIIEKRKRWMRNLPWSRSELGEEGLEIE